MRLGIAGLTRELGEIDAVQLAKVRSLGFGAIVSVLRMDEPPSAADIRRVRALLDDHGVVLAHVRLRQCPFVAAEEGRAETALPLIRRGLELAGQLGTRVAVMPGGGFNPNGLFYPHPRNRTDEALELMISRCRQVIKAAEDNGVYLAPEPHSAAVLFSPLRMKRLLDAVGSLNLGVHLDAINWMTLDNVFATTEFFDQTFDLFGDRIVSGDLKDVVVEEKLIIHLSETFVGNGVADTGAYLRRFAQLEPWKVAVIEHVAEPDIPTARAFVERVARDGGVTWTEQERSR
jgi:sugar phosphate isomerase/epimerase